MVARLVRIEKVRGSIPLSSTSGGSVELHVQHFPRLLHLVQIGEGELCAVVEEPRRDGQRRRADEDLVDEVLEQQFPGLAGVHRRVGEALVERPDRRLVLEQRGLDVFGLDRGVQLLLLLLQRRHRLGRGLVEDPCRDRLHEVGQLALNVASTGLQGLQDVPVALVGPTVVVSHVDRQRGQHLGVVEEGLHDLDHALLDVVLPHPLGRALLLALVQAVVVPVLPASPRRARDTFHRRAAALAEQLARQPVVRCLVAQGGQLGLRLRAAALVHREHLLDLLERLVVDDLRHPAWDHVPGVGVLTDVGPVLQHLVQRLGGEREPVGRADAGSVHLVADALHRLAGGIVGEHLLDHRGVLRVQLVALVSADGEAEDLPAVGQGLLGEGHAGVDGGVLDRLLNRLVGHLHLGP